jgi:hypothetical protein
MSALDGRLRPRYALQNWGGDVMSTTIRRGVRSAARRAGIHAAGGEVLSGARLGDVGLVSEMCPDNRLVHAETGDRP